MSASQLFRYSILIGHKIVLCSDERLFVNWNFWSDLLGWSRVAETFLGDIRVSTVFVPTIHITTEDKFFHYLRKPFETMIFGGVYDQRGWRYDTFSEALEGHQRICDCLEQGIEPYDD